MAANGNPRIPSPRRLYRLGGILAALSMLTAASALLKSDQAPQSAAGIPGAAEDPATTAEFASDRFATGDPTRWPQGAFVPYNGGEEIAASLAPAQDTTGGIRPQAQASPHKEAVATAAVMEPPPDLDAAAFAVVERGCGALVWGENETERLRPASLTKIVAALVVMDSVSLDQEVESHVSSALLKDQGSSVMGLEPGMRLSVLDLLNGLLLESGNDAALVLAEFAGSGNVATFIAAMNAKAKALGMTDTQFTNPHGLDQDGHYSSALDLALAGEALLEDPVLAEIAASEEYWPDWEESSLRNGNKLLQRYDGAYGIKIGYTRRADQTMVAAAERDGRHLIVSLLGSKDRYADSTLLLDWAFTRTASACG
jgi:D-alanyl-D-alanine carboxypeptidase